MKAGVGEDHILIVQGSLEDLNTLDAIINNTVDKFGRIDVLVMTEDQVAGITGVSLDKQRRHPQASEQGDERRGKLRLRLRGQRQGVS